MKLYMPSPSPAVLRFERACMVLGAAIVGVTASCAPEPVLTCEGDYGIPSTKYKPAFETMEESCEAVMEAIG